jgi:hypothetical protein
VVVKRCSIQCQVFKHHSTAVDCHACRCDMRHVSVVVPTVHWSPDSRRRNCLKCIRFLFLLNISFSVVTMSSSSASPASTTTSSDGTLWDIQDVIAQRSTIDGRTELLVAFKPTWIPFSDMHSDCPVMRKFKDTIKMVFVCESGTSCIELPVEPGSALAQDFADDKAAVISSAIRDAGFRRVVVTMSPHSFYRNARYSSSNSSDLAAPQPKKQNGGNQ